jgi:hypothetical protein
VATLCTASDGTTDGEGNSNALQELLTFHRGESLKVLMLWAIVYDHGFYRQAGWLRIRPWASEVSQPLETMGVGWCETVSHRSSPEELSKDHLPGPHPQGGREVAAMSEGDKRRCGGCTNRASQDFTISHTFLYTFSLGQERTERLGGLGDVCNHPVAV